MTRPSASSASIPWPSQPFSERALTHPAASRHAPDEPSNDSGSGRVGQVGYPAGVRILNVHERVFSAAPADVGALLETLGADDDRLWPGPPSGRWPRMRLAGGLTPGARGGHGPVRYRVVEHVPGERVRFAFEPGGLSRGLVGHHRFELEARPGATVLRHVIEAEARGAASVRWALLVRPLHDALIEDALDLAELRLTGRVARPARWSAWVRALRLAIRTGGRLRRRGG